MYYYLHYKTKISLKYLFIDNPIVILISVILFLLLHKLSNNLIAYFVSAASIPLLGFIITMIRFWRTPVRKVVAKNNQLVSPADGNVIYIKKVEKGEIPVSIKQGLKATLSELSQTNLLDHPSWLIGINMTPFDVHKNCAPVSGTILLNKHISGEFLSLKNPEAILRNERNTLVLVNENKEVFGIIQTASKLVKRIDSYVKVGDVIKQGEWFGMIRFGSQVDIIIPTIYSPEIQLGQQVYAAKTIIASK
ncbi:phosphatidylserine decarboxylase [Saccharicrinis sp. FJH62]|uniref:phosphatidylserine decarboxylase n=1 Tax=Saccharicrinis sp. FJH62 TaxID=3344657 RepID=UPI0035D42E2D